MAGQAQSRPELQLQEQQAAPPWGELLSFQYFQRLCPPGAGYGYSGGSMQGMRESEFRRLGGAKGILYLQEEEEDVISVFIQTRL